MHIHVSPGLSSLLLLSVTFSLSLDRFSEISMCKSIVARPTPFFFQLHMRMQCIAWVYMNAQCATIKMYVRTTHSRSQHCTSALRCRGKKMIITSTDSALLNIQFIERFVVIYLFWGIKMKSKAAPVYPFLPLIQEGISFPHIRTTT